MNEKSWKEETENPSKYQVTPHGLAQAVGETNSKILPYDQKEHAWSFEQLDAMNPYSWEEETENPSHYQVTPYDALIQSAVEGDSDTDSDDEDGGGGCNCGRLA